MEKFIIRIPKNLTSYTFYNHFLHDLHKYCIEAFSSDLVLDLSLTKVIDPTVIPNLLCVGYIIREKTKKTPQIYIPNTLASTEIKRYLNEIGFINFAENCNLFSIDPSIKGGWSGQKMDKLNTTLFFKEDESEAVSWANMHRAIRFIRKYLQYYSNDNSNSIIDFSKEIIENSKIHGKSFSFMTIQYNYKREKVYLSYSDCGVGFLKSFEEKRLEAEIHLLNKIDITNEIYAREKIEKQLEDLLKNKLENELEGIIKGVYTRFNEPYGLFSVIQKALLKGGIVRIHSNNTQVVFTENTSLLLNVATDDHSLRNLINNISPQNIRKNIKFPGVHIEIELPLQKSEVYKNV